MKALVLAEFGRLDVEERPDPIVGDDEVVVRLVATGICGSDIHGYTGDNGRRFIGQIMGHESVGTVAAIGVNVKRTDLRLGAVVTFNPVVIPEADLEAYAGREQHHSGRYVIGVRADLVSSFAQLIAVPARNIVVLPVDMPISHGALVEPLAVAVHAVRRAAVKSDSTVVVLGGGPIGQSIVLALRMLGVERIAVTEVMPERRALLQDLGAYVIDPRTEQVAEAIVREFGGLADVAIDAVGVSATLADGIAATGLGATICLVGMGATSLTVDAFRISTDERSIVGSFTYSSADFNDAANWVGKWPELVARLISREVSIDEADAAFSALAAGDGTPGKVLVRLDS